MKRSLPTVLNTLVTLMTWEQTSVSFAGVVTLDTFGPDALVESFEGLSPRPGLEVSDKSGFLDVVGPLTLDSGIELRYRLAPPQAPSSIGDFVLGDMADGFEQGFEDLAPSHVPDGSAFLSAVTVSSLSLRFTTPMRRVGFFAISNVGATAIFVGTQGEELATLDVSILANSEWSTSFLGFEHAGGIEQIDFGGLACRRVGGCGKTSLIDHVIFEPVPEPHTLAVLAFGVALTCLRSRLRQTNC